MPDESQLLCLLCACFLCAEPHKTDRCPHVVNGLVAVLPCQTEGLEERFQFVGVEARSQQAYQFERVETAVSVCLHRVVAVSSQTVVEDVVIVAGVVPEDRVRADVGKEAAQGFCRSEQLAGSHLLMVDGIHGVFLVAELRQDGLAGFDIQVERLADDFPAPDAHGGNLDDVVGEDIQAGCLGVEYDDFSS